MIKERLFSYYLKKADKANISKAVSDINKSIVILKREAGVFSKAVDVVEAKYGKNNKAEEASTIFTFLNLSMLDILILHKQYLSTNDTIEKNFICRTAAQHMYEFLEDGSKVLGKQMNYLTDRFNNPQVDLKLTELRKSFNELKKELHSPLKKLRHNVSGHKDRNIRNQLAISDSIEVDDFQDNFIFFMQFFMTLIKFKRLVVDELKKRHHVDNDTTIANSQD